MRRKDREITDRTEIINIIKKCSVCRLALFDIDYPYIVPLNFGLYYDDDIIELYFHCANIGKKLDLIEKNNNAGFEMDTSHELILSETACGCTMGYESVIGSGRIIVVDEETKIKALDCIVSKYTGKKLSYSEEYVKTVKILKLSVNNITRKKLKK